MYLISACLIGINCRYNGETKLNMKILNLFKKKGGIPICPEQLGGLSTPREPAEIIDGDGLDVIEGKAKVLTISGKDVTQNFIKGAEEVLKIVKYLNIKEAILKEKSPSCGVNFITKNGASISGIGVLSALLKIYRVNLFTEDIGDEIL